MRILIAEDDFASRRLLLKFLSAYGTCDCTVDGMEALEAFMLALEDEEPYDLVCLDIMMPKLDGLKALKNIRDLEDVKGVKNRCKVIMMTALNDKENVYSAFDYGCEAYAAKPIDLEKLVEVMKKLNLIE